MELKRIQKIYLTYTRQIGETQITTDALWGRERPAGASIISCLKIKDLTRKSSIMRASYAPFFFY